MANASTGRLATAPGSLLVTDGVGPYHRTSRQAWPGAHETEKGEGTLDSRLTEALAEYQRRTPRSGQLWQRAKTWTPLGVHSNYRFLEPYPFFASRAKGVNLWDADGNEYLDFNMGFGALQSGHAHPRIVEAQRAQLENGTIYGYEFEKAPDAAERICRRYGMAQVRFSSTGLEATHHATRIARASTGRKLILKFEGGYHGSHDTLLVGVKPRVETAGPAKRPHSVPASLGILPEVSSQTLVAPFNDLEATRAIARAHAKDLAAVILEPIPMNMGFVSPEPGFLPGLRELCTELGALLIFDEIKTGTKFYRGATGHFGVRPDLMTLGKSIACGVPISAIAAQPGIMDNVGPRKISHAGTYNSNPLSIVTCIATFDHILTEENLARSARLCERLAKGYTQILHDAGVTGSVSADGVSGSVYFSDHPVRDWRSFQTVDGERSMVYFYSCLNRGLIPGGTGPDEQWTVSVVHTETHVDQHLAVLASIADRLKGAPKVGEMDEAV
jgi:glutamate-1-semialdehyde 2,1-aminomutase